MGRNPPSVRLRQNAAQNSKRETSKKETRKLNQTKKVEPESGGLVFPGGDTAFKALLSARFCAAIWSHVTDCDETYNYWEPMHFLIFGKGLQTWEYSPEYALRSYTYLLLHATPAFIYHKILQPNPLLIFYFVRCLLGLLCAFAEVYFYKAVCKEFGIHIAGFALLFQLSSAGMFISSAALLPSSWAMYAVSAACAAWWQTKYALAIFFIAIVSLLGWPFAALLGIPIAFDMLILKRKYKTFFLWALISAAAILGPMIAIDSSYYGKLVIAPWNLIPYNVFGGQGSELYGTEPFSFNIINVFLNFNIVGILALLSPVALLLSYLFVLTKSPTHILSLSPFVLWLAVFLIQQHKEERFLFPIYPCICLCGTVTIDIIHKLWFRLYYFIKTPSHGSYYFDYNVYITLSAIIISSLLGVSRVLPILQDDKSQIYNASVVVVSIVLSILGALLAIYVKTNWELSVDALVSIILIIIGTIFLVSLQTENIFVYYGRYVIFNILNHFVITIAILEVSKYILRDTQGLAFGLNTFIVLILQTILTVLVNGDVAFVLTPRK